MRWIIFALLIVCLPGCGSDRVPTYPVKGRVEFADGKPVRTGTIELESKDFGTTASGTIQEDGSFILGTYTSNDGAAAGAHRAIVVQIIISDGIIKHTKDHGRAVPPKFADYNTSTLTTTIAPTPENNIVVTLPEAD